ncbi:MAG: type II toxin-antitoxin system death-on-curing family toxin [Polyangiaceae bacterium]
MKLSLLVFVSVDELLEIHAAAIEATGGSDGLRDRGLLEAAAAAPQRSAFGELAYPSIARMAAALSYSIAKNHAFVDGNKRVAHAAARVFLKYNGFHMNLPPDWATVIEAVASGAIGQDELVGKFAEALGGDTDVTDD